MAPQHGAWIIEATSAAMTTGNGISWVSYSDVRRGSEGAGVWVHRSIDHYVEEAGTCIVTYRDFSMNCLSLTSHL